MLKSTTEYPHGRRRKDADNDSVGTQHNGEKPNGDDRQRPNHHRSARRIVAVPGN
uniref:Uncharacterized protein n=1 Tax=Anopheles atroparvus TaxID=41427 RepID=A0AAG5CWP9_ANOAO